MKVSTIRNELALLTENFVLEGNAKGGNGFHINYTASASDEAKIDFEKIKNAGFDAKLSGKKHKTISIEYKVNKKHGFRIIDVSK